MKIRATLIALSMLLAIACGEAGKENTSENKAKEKAPFIWENANVYFLLTDRFNNGDPSNDVNHERTKETSALRGFMGGDIKGITQKIKEGYFNKLGINAIWLSPIVEQIHGGVDEGTGFTYGFHGYWTKDWTKLEPNFGTEADMHELVKTAHENGIRILLDIVINHTGPVTDIDPVWPSEWVRTEPQCTYQDYETAVTCTLVKNLPDVKTEDNDSVGLPEHLVKKWTEEGRLDNEIAELDEFFSRTGLTRAPKNYIIKWLTDFIRTFGIDGYRLDTVKHVEESVWGDLIKEAIIAFNDWKKANPEAVLDDNDFYIVGETYGYNIAGGRFFDFGDKKVDYFDYGFSSQINFGFKYDANKSYEELFSYYSSQIKDSLGGAHVMNYISSHDDGGPFDKLREKPFESANKLFLSPGVAQVYYGDESSRILQFEGANGDANLRTFMNWDEIKEDKLINGNKISDVLTHWQKLGTFRSQHPAIGAGEHKMLSESPYVFSRKYNSEKFSETVVVGLDLAKGKKEIVVKDIFEDGTLLTDYYSGTEVEVKEGKVVLENDNNIALLAI